MHTWNKLLLHISLGALCASFLGVPLQVVAQQAGPEKSAQPAVANNTDQQPAAESSSSQLPDSPGVTLARLEADQQAATQSASAPPSSASSAAQPAQYQASPQKPVGTAAAEAPDASGIAASQPAGAAIAPAKQHRVRTIVIKVGAIIGAGVAVGTVVGLTEATSSKPPGAH